MLQYLAPLNIPEDKCSLGTHGRHGLGAVVGVLQAVESNRIHGPANRPAISGAVCATKRWQSKKREPKEKEGGGESRT